MTAHRSMTVLAIRSGATADEKPPAEGETLVANRGGETLGQRDQMSLWSFLSPTEAILTALDACASASGAGIAIGVSIGEVSLEEDKASGEPIDVACALAVGARAGWVYISEAAQLSVNHNEVESRNVGGVALGAKQVLAFRARRGGRSDGRSDGPSTGDSKTDAPATSSSHRNIEALSPSRGLISIAGLCLGLLILGVVGYWVRSMPCSLGGIRQAESRGEISFAIEQTFEAWSVEPGRPEIADLLQRLHLSEVERFLKAKRPDRALFLLRRVRKLLPFDDELDDALFRSGSEQMRAWILAGRPKIALEEEQRLIAELPVRVLQLHKAYYEARLEALELEMKPKLASGKRVSYEVVRDWSSLLDLVYKDFPHWGRIRYLWGRISVANRRWDEMGKQYLRAIRADSSYSGQRQILVDIVRACKATTNFRSFRNLVNSRKVLAEGLGDWVVPELVKHLEARHSVLRLICYFALKARGTLPAKGLLDYHLRNMALESSTTEKVSAVNAEALMGALDFLASLTRLEDVTRGRRALEALPALAKKDEIVRKRAKEVLVLLEGRSG